MGQRMVIFRTISFRDQQHFAAEETRRGGAKMDTLMMAKRAILMFWIFRFLISIPPHISSIALDIGLYHVHRSTISLPQALFIFLGK